MTVCDPGHRQLCEAIQAISTLLLIENIFSENRSYQMYFSITAQFTVITAIYKYRHLVLHYSQDVIFLSNEQKMKLLQSLCKIMRNC